MFSEEPNIVSESMWSKNKRDLKMVTDFLKRINTRRKPLKEIAVSSKF